MQQYAVHNMVPVAAKIAALRSDQFMHKSTGMQKPYAYLVISNAFRRVHNRPARHKLSTRELPKTLLGSSVWMGAFMFDHGQRTAQVVHARIRTMTLTGPREISVCPGVSTKAACDCMPGAHVWSSRN